MSMSAEKKSALLRDIRHLLIMAAVILTGRSVLADWYVVPTGSMKPTILEGDRVFVWKSAYQIRVPFSRIRLFETGRPERGDVVVLRNPDGGSVPFVKRLIGMPGDRIELRREVLYVNGQPQPFDIVREEKLPDGHPVLLGNEYLMGKPHPIRILPNRPAYRDFPEIVVPEGEVFVMGDNRDESRDGRFFGTRPIADLLGRAVGVMWSWDPEIRRGPRLNRVARAFIRSVSPDGSIRAEVPQGPQPPAAQPPAAATPSVSPTPGS